MNKNILIGGVIVIAVILGVFLFTGGDSTSSNTNTITGEKINVKSLSERERLVEAVTDYQCIILAQPESQRQGQQGNRETAMEIYAQYDLTEERVMELSEKYALQEGFLFEIQAAHDRKCPELS
tara:strand:- start:137 stop:508 length:372 start_codon:yes stop_codon:yes gene_type:complete